MNNTDEYFIADGKPHPISRGGFQAMLTIRCEDGAVQFSVRENDADNWLWMKPAGPGLLEVRYGGFPEKNGLYRLE